jgi:hypothetical protein
VGERQQVEKVMSENGFSDVSKKNLEKISDFCSQSKRGLNSMVHDREITEEQLAEIMLKFVNKCETADIRVRCVHLIFDDKTLRDYFKGETAHIAFETTTMDAFKRVLAETE